MTTFALRVVDCEGNVTVGEYEDAPPGEDAAGVLLSGPHQQSDSANRGTPGGVFALGLP